LPALPGHEQFQQLARAGHDPDAGSQEKRNLLAVVIADVTRELKPAVVVVENVAAFLTRKIRHPETQEAVSAASLLISLLAEDYMVFPILTDAMCNFS
jgi:DNA (cytosine-5)-methyltransferase 1